MGRTRNTGTGPRDVGFMKTQDIHKHWTECAGTGVHATTPATTAKVLEIAAFCRRFRELKIPAFASVLDVGCGNGLNCIALAKQFPQMRFYGVDYVHEMIDAARQNAKEHNVANRVHFALGDILHLDEILKDHHVYDVVLTDRCIINLNTQEQQERGLAALVARTKRGGYLLLIENSIQARELQNECRQFFGLSERPPPPFNLFLDEDWFFPYLFKLGLSVDVEDISSLHDLILYVLVPAITAGGEVDYDHPMVQAATALALKMPHTFPFQFGQNRLFVCRCTGE